LAATKGEKALPARSLRQNTGTLCRISDGTRQSNSYIVTQAKCLSDLFFLYREALAGLL